MEVSLARRPSWNLIWDQEQESLFDLTTFIMSLIDPQPAKTIFSQQLNATILSQTFTKPVLPCGQAIGNYCTSTSSFKL